MQSKISLHIVKTQFFFFKLIGNNHICRCIMFISVGKNRARRQKIYNNDPQNKSVVLCLTLPWSDGGKNHFYKRHVCQKIWWGGLQRNIQSNIYTVY